MWAGGGIDVGDPMLKIEKCCEGDRAPPTPQKWENKFRNIWLSMIKESYGNPSLERNVCSNWHYEVHPLITFVTVIFVHVIAKITFYESKSQTSSKTFPENSVFGIMSLTVSLENSSMRILWVPFQFLWNIWSGARLYHQKTHPDQAFFGYLCFGWFLH